MLWTTLIVCKEGFYDANCSSKCGHCEENKVCDKSYGYCLRGCKMNYQPPYCTGKILLKIYSNAMLSVIFGEGYIFFLFTHEYN